MLMHPRTFTRTDTLLPYPPFFRASQLGTLAAGRPAGVCLAHGGPTSHVAILCAGMGIPALVAMGTALDAVADGDDLLLDAEAGHVTAAPSPAARDAFAARQLGRASCRERVGPYG